jgi:hypothetical protein
VVFFLIWRFYWCQAGVTENVPQSPFPVAPRSTTLPPEPRLEQIDHMARKEKSNVVRRLSAEEKILNSRGPTADEGFVHIPIQEAIQAVAAEARAGKLPQRKSSPSANNRGLLDAGEPNSGRVFRGEER